jgi:hypothetical protein
MPLEWVSALVPNRRAVYVLSACRASLEAEGAHMTTSALGPRRGGWQRPVSLSANLAELRGH